MIRIDHLSFAYEKYRPVLHDISLCLPAGEIVSILGPNGCGKSTLLKIILGFLQVKRGMVFLDDRDICDLTEKQLHKRLSYVPQMHSGTFNYQVLDVVLMGRTTESPWYRFRSEDYDIARAALKQVRMERHARRPYLHLSGGERQLVLIARSLAQGGVFFIMDEPVSGLDYGNQFHLLQTLKDLSGRGVSFILTTHHPQHALYLGGRALLLKSGKIIADGASTDVITRERICELYQLPESFAENTAEKHW
ncbi:ABC transporter ATP-binding protein [Desulfosarcina sp. OttesenSCG-928-B08]|nr:ABC transporter ATP-binding protein [Desulfosarcina sp. OttesenSCG-928-B08]